MGGKNTSSGSALGGLYDNMGDQEFWDMLSPTTQRPLSDMNFTETTTMPGMGSAFGDMFSEGGFFGQGGFGQQIPGYLLGYMSMRNKDKQNKWERNRADKADKDYYAFKDSWSTGGGTNRNSVTHV